MRAAVEQREEFAVDMEHDDVAAGNFNHLVAAGRDVRGAGDDVTGHMDQSKLVDGAGIAVEDFAALHFRQRRPERKARIVKVPVRIIRREQQAVDADPFDQRAQVSGLVRLVDRLRREPEMLLHIFRRPALEMRDLGAEFLKMLVHPPHRRRYPAKAAFDEHDFQFRETFGNAFEHEAGEHRRHGMRIALVLLGVIGRPAAAGRRVAAIAADMDADGKIEFLRPRIDRPVAAAAERLVGARRDVDLDVFARFGATVDLGDRKLRVVLPDQDRGFQARVAVAPERQLPVIDGALDRGAEFEILLREDEEVEHLQNAELDVERIEVLLLHEGRDPSRAPRRSAARRRAARSAARSADRAWCRYRACADGCHRFSDAPASAWAGTDRGRNGHRCSDGCRSR